MSNTREMPVHTARIVLELNRKAGSFNQLQNMFRLSPSTLSRILRFLRTNGCVSVEIIDTRSRSIRKVYTLTGRGKRLVAPMKKLEDTELEIMRYLK